MLTFILKQTLCFVLLTEMELHNTMSSICIPPPDINECVEGTNNCHEKATCINLIGSYRCICRPGYSGNGFICTGKEQSAIYK